MLLRFSYLGANIQLFCHTEHIFPKKVWFRGCRREDGLGLVGEGQPRYGADNDVTPLALKP